MGDFLKKLHPFTKLLFVFGAGILSIRFKNIQFIIMMSLIYCFLSILGNVGSSFIKNYIKLFIFFGLFLILINALFNGSADAIAVSFWKFNLRSEGLQQGVFLSAVILAFSGGFLLFNYLTEIEDIMLALEKTGLQPRAVYMVIATIRMIPDMKAQSERIMDAQKSRGIECRGNALVRIRMLLPTTMTLLLSAMVNADEISLTLEARGFGLGRTKTYIRDLKVAKADKIIMLLITICVVIGFSI